MQRTQPDIGHKEKSEPPSHWIQETLDKSINITNFQQMLGETGLYWNILATWYQLPACSKALLFYAYIYLSHYVLMNFSVSTFKFTEPNISTEQT